MGSKKRYRYMVWLFVLAAMFTIGYGGKPVNVMAKGNRTTVIKSVSLKIGNKKVAKKTYKMKKGERKKIKVSVSPNKGNKTIKFATNNKKVVEVDKSGRITAKETGRAKITVTAKSGKKKKTAWVKIKVTNKTDSDSTDDKNAPEADAPTTDSPETQNPVRKKSIVVYFSCTDNTKIIAEYVKDCTASDIYRIEPSVPYTSADLNYSNSDSRTSKEQNDASARPAIAGNLPSLNNYEVVYLGYPIWWGQAPKIMYTFVENYDLSGKTVIPFCTSGGSGIGTSATNLQAAARGNAIWLPGRRFAGSSPKADVESWISGLGL